MTAGGFIFIYLLRNSDHTISKHGFGNFQEPCNICAHYIISGITICIGGIQCRFMDALHDAVQLLVNFFPGP